MAAERQTDSEAVLLSLRAVIEAIVFDSSRFNLFYSIVIVISIFLLKKAFERLLL